MRRTCIFVVLVALSIDMSAASVSAQMAPRRNRGYGGYDVDAYDAAVAINALNNANAASRQQAQDYQAWRDRPISQSITSTQRDVRGAMNADAQRREQYIFDQRQTNRDWWFQTQQQQLAGRQMAERQAVGAGPQYPVAPPSAPATRPPAQATQWENLAGGSQYQSPPWQDQALRRQSQEAEWRDQLAQFAPGFEAAPSAAPPAADRDVIKWLPLLCEPQFAQQRARIEAPYRRSSQGLSRPTAKDYRDMIDAAGKMKTILKGMSSYVAAQDYLDAEAFLDKLTAEARSRLEEATAKKPQK